MKPVKVSVSFGATIQTRPYENIQPLVTMEAELEDGDTLDNVTGQLLAQARFQIADQVKRLLDYGVQRLDGFLLPDDPARMDRYLGSQFPMYGWLQMVDPGAATQVKMLAVNQQAVWEQEAVAAREAERQRQAEEQAEADRIAAELAAEQVAPAPAEVEQPAKPKGSRRNKAKGIIPLDENGAPEGTEEKVLEAEGIPPADNVGDIPF